MILMHVPMCCICSRYVEFNSPPCNISLAFQFFQFHLVFLGGMAKIKGWCPHLRGWCSIWEILDLLLFLLSVILDLGRGFESRELWNYWNLLCYFFIKMKKSNKEVSGLYAELMRLLQTNVHFRSKSAKKKAFQSDANYTYMSMNAQVQ